MAEIGDDGKLDAQYLYLGGHRPVARIAGRSLHAIHTDHLGAPRLMTDDDGQVVWRARYAPFGEAELLVEHVPLALRLPGQLHDPETGTHYNYLRDYDPATGRYVTSDPIGLDGGPNTYAYVGGRPLTAIDPLGLAAQAALPFVVPAGSAVATWVAGVGAAVTPVGVIGGVALVALAGVYWATQSHSSEQAFEEAMGRRADAGEYAAMLEMFKRFHPGLADANFLAWDGTWTSYHRLAAATERAQRDYVAEHERFTAAHPNTCSTQTNLDLYEEALAATAAWDDARRMVADAGALGLGVLKNPGSNEDRVDVTASGFPAHSPGQDSTTSLPEDRPDTSTATEFPTTDTEAVGQTTFPVEDGEHSVLMSTGSEHRPLKEGDTRSPTRHQALTEAKLANKIAISAQPVRTVRPNTPEGREEGLDSRNVVLYEYVNRDGQRIFIREDKAASYGDGGQGDQEPHFNSGPNKDKLLLHHFFP